MIFSLILCIQVIFQGTDESRHFWSPFWSRRVGPVRIWGLGQGMMEAADSWNNPKRFGEIVINQDSAAGRRDEGRTISLEGWIFGNI